MTGQGVLVDGQQLELVRRAPVRRRRVADRRLLVLWTRLCWLSSHALAAISATAVATIRAPGGMRMAGDRSRLVVVTGRRRTSYAARHADGAA
jgi:hypothetical protein